MSRVTRLRHIALVGQMEFAHVREVLHGVHHHAMGSLPWIFRHYQVTEKHCEPMVSRPDGIIAQANDPGLASDLAAVGVPVVNFSSVLEVQPFPAVHADNHAIGRMAAEYFLDRGFRSFGFVPLVQCHFSTERQVAFAAALDLAKHAFSVCPPDVSPAQPPGDAPGSGSVIQWLKSLPKPVGIFVSTDWLAVRISECCREAGIGVPDTVALLGVNNDPFVCQTTWPPLSSIRTPNAAVGAEAARILVGLMEGGAPPKTPVLIPPSLVVTRGSTDVLAVRDPLVADALAFMEANATRDIQVSDVLDRVLVSRRRLEQVFRAALGRSPLEQINRMHCSVARRLLVTSDKTMPDVARLSGFSGPMHMAKVFRRVVGQSPSAFRRMHSPRSR